MVASIYTLKSASEAVKYYKPQNYYFKDGSSEQDAPEQLSQWWGAGAKALGLTGAVDPKQFEAILEGKLPNGQNLGRRYKGEWQHKPGFDLTFSMCKSASVMYLVAGDERIKGAQERAVNKTLQFIEDTYQTVRIRQGDNFNISKGGKLIVAQFPHQVSRENDPQAHTHCVIANAVLCPDGRWRSMWNEDLYDLSILSGAHYDAEFAYELRELGYPLHKTEKGFYEITGVLPETNKTFSKRRGQIEKDLEERGESGGHAASRANFRTRKHQQVVEEKVLKEKWVNECEQHGQSLESLEQMIQAAKTLGTSKLEKPSVLATEAVNRAIESLSEREAVFIERHLLKEALALSRPGLATARIIKDIKLAIEDKRVISVGIERGELHVTTQKAIDLENSIVQNMQAGQNKCKPVYQAVGVATKLAETALTDGQYEAVKLIMTSTDRFISIQGHTGTGKTTMLKYANKLLEDKGYRVIGLTDSGKARRELAEKSGIKECYTLSYFLTYAAHNEERIMPKGAFAFLFGDKAKKTYFVIDESSMVSNVQAEAVMGIISKRQARACFSGDEYQHSSINAGKPVEVLRDKGISRISMTEIKRQENNPELKASIEAIYKKEMLKAFSLLENKLVEIKEKEPRLNTLVYSYMKSPNQDDRHVVVMANNDRVTVNTLIRQALNAEGTLKGIEIDTNILENKQLTLGQKRYAGSYGCLEVVRFNRDYATLGVTKNSYYTVIRVSEAEEKVTLQSKDGKSIIWYPDKVAANADGGCEVYRCQSRQLSEGDSIKWTRKYHDKESHGRLNRNTGEKAKVLSVAEQTATVKLVNGAVVELDLLKTSNQHWDHAYADTSYTAQGGDWKDVHGLIEAYRINLSHLRSFLVTISRAKENVTIYCDNKANLLSAVRRLLTKTSALEALENQHETDTKQNKQLDQNMISNLDGAKANVPSETTPVKPPTENKNIEISKETTQTAKMVSTRENVEKIISQLKTPTELVAAKRIEQSLSAEQELATDAVHYAFAKLTERDAVFIESDLLQNAAKFASGQTTIKYIIEAIEQEKYSEMMISAGKVQQSYAKNKDSEPLWTTKEMVELEKAIISLMQAVKNSTQPILDQSGSAISELKGEKRLTDGQRAAIELLLTSKDAVNGIQGVAGSGKTTMLREVKRLAEQQDYKVIGLSNTSTAKNKLHQSTGMECMTVRKFLNWSEKHLCQNPEKLKETLTEKSLIILDESSFASNRDMFSLINTVKTLGGDIRLGLVGDVRQIGAVGSGKPFYVLMSYGMKTATMNQIVRVQDKQALSRIRDIYSFKIHDALSKVQSVQEIEDLGERLGKIAQDYLKLTSEQRVDTLVVTPKNKHRKIVNERIRNGLKTQHVLRGMEIKTNILVSKDLTLVEREHIANYKIKDVIRFNQSQPGIGRGEYVTIESKDFLNQKLILKNSSGKNVTWSPSRQGGGKGGTIEIYDTQTRKIMGGDTIRWRRNDEKQNIVNSETAKVIGVLEDRATVELANGSRQIIQFNEKQNQHWDHAYACTVHAAQGLEFKLVLAHGEGPKMHEFEQFTDVKPHRYPKSTNLSGLLVVLSRGEQVQLYVDNCDNYEKIVALHRYPKASALEAYDKNWDKLASKVDILTTDVRGNINDNGIKDLLINSAQILSDQGSPFSKQDVLSLASSALNERASHQDLTKAIDSLVAKGELVHVGCNVITTPKAYENTLAQISTETLKSISSTTEKKPYLDANIIRHALHQDVLTAAINIKGDSPSLRSSNEARWGNKGSLKVTLAGPKAGSWKDWESGNGGSDLISFFMYVEGISQTREGYHEALVEISQQYDLTDAAKQKYDQPYDKEQASLNQARKLFDKSVAIKSTPAEKFMLRPGIEHNIISNDIRYHDGIPLPEKQGIHKGMLIGLRDSNGQLVGVCAYYLDARTGTVTRANNYKPRYFGQAKLGTIQISQGNTDNPRTAIVCVDIIDASILAKADPSTPVYATTTLGGISNVSVHQSVRSITLVTDDRRCSNTNEVFQLAAKGLSARNFQVKLCHPENKKSMLLQFLSDNNSTKNIEETLKNASILYKAGEVKLAEKTEQKDNITLDWPFGKKVLLKEQTALIPKLNQAANKYNFGYLEQTLEQSKQNAEIAKKKQDTLNYAMNLYNNKTISMKHKDAEIARQYLKNRGLAGQYTSEFRFSRGIKHPHTKKYTLGILLPVKDKDNNNIGIVRIYLQGKGEKYKAKYKDQAGNMQTAVPRANLGNTGRGAVILNDGNSQNAYVAKGIETALSLGKQGTSDKVMATLSASANFANAPITKNDTHITLCADNDGNSLNNLASLQKACQKFLNDGKQVYIAIPKMLQGKDKTDFNDILVKHGKSEVQKMLEQAVKIRSAQDIHLDQRLDKTLADLPQQYKHEELDSSGNKNDLQKVSSKTILDGVKIEQAEKIPAILDRDI